MNSIYIYVAFCLFFFLLGVLFTLPKYRTTASKIFIASLFLVPSGSFLIKYYFISQVYAWYFYIFGPALVLLLRCLKSGSLNFFTTLSSIGILLFVLFFLTYGVMIEEKEIINTLIDLKVFILLLFGSVYFTNTKEYLSNFFSSRLWHRILAINFVTDTTLFFLNYKFNIAYQLTGDGHYLNDVARYGDLSIPFLVLFIIYKYLKKESYSVLEFVFVLFPIIYSGNRTLLVAVVLIFLMYLTRLPVKKLIYFGFGLTIFTLVISIQIIGSDDESVLSRAKVLFDTDEITKKMTARMEPVTVEVDTWDSPVYWILGKGLGKSLYIPWFDYRENVNNYNPYMDNIYLTLFVKYGVTSLLIYFYLIAYFKYLTKDGRFTVLLIGYLFFMGLTTAFLYQSSFFIFLLSPVFFLKNIQS